MSETVHILTDGAHALAEIVWEISFLIIGYLLNRWQVKREHRRLDTEHGVDHNDPSGMWEDNFGEDEEPDSDGSWTDLDTHPIPYHLRESNPL